MKMGAEFNQTQHGELEASPSSPIPLSGDVLELMLTHVPLVDLVPASHVSTSWKRAVSSSLRHFNPIKPWLLVHTQGTRAPHAVTTRAFDPRSRSWMAIRRPDNASLSASAALRSSHSNILYVLSPTKFSFSVDPLHLSWHHVGPPLVWRFDPIVALVGRHVVIAGGACDFEDDPLAVETYDLATGAWDSSDDMPDFLKDSFSSTWLSIAADEERMYVTEKASGLVYAYDPNAKTWQGPYDLRPQREMFCCAVGFANDRMVLVGLMGSGEGVEGVRAWEVERGTWRLRELGEMPAEMVGKMKGKRCCPSAVRVCSGGELVYVIVNGDGDSDGGAALVYWCEVESNGVCKWGSVEDVAAGGRSQSKRTVFSCSVVGLSDLSRANFGGGDRRLVLEDTESE